MVVIVTPQQGLRRLSTEGLMSAITMRSRIEKGAQLLDRVRPGWDGELDLGNLDIEFENTCVLAWTDGTYSKGRDRIFFGFSKNLGAARHGLFSIEALAGKDPRHPDVRVEYADLTAAWKDFIAERRAVA